MPFLSMRSSAKAAIWPVFFLLVSLSASAANSTEVSVASESTKVSEQATFSEDAVFDETIVAAKVYMPKLPPVSRSAAIYLTLENHSDKAVTLTGVTTPAAHHAMIHQTIEEDGMAKMRHQDRLVIPAQGKLVFQPGSYHIMLMGLDRALINAPFELTLEFAHRSPMTLTVKPAQ